MNFKITTLFLLLSVATFAQKKPLDHTAYKEWSRIENSAITNQGNYTFYSVKPLRGDGYVVWVNNVMGKRDSVYKGIKPVFSGNESFIAMRKTAGFDTLYKQEVAKIAKDKMLKDTLVVYLFDKDTLLNFANLDQFQVSEENGWIAFTQTIEVKKPIVKKKKWWQFRKPKKIIPPLKTNGKRLTLMNPAIGKSKTIENVTDFLFDPKGNKLLYTTHSEAKKDSVRLNLVTLTNLESTLIGESYLEVAELVFSNNGEEIAYHASTDTNETKQFDIFYTVNKNLQSIGTMELGLNQKTVSSFKPAAFSKNGKTLYFGIASKPKQTPKDSLIESEKLKLDLWSFNDKRIQTQQLVELSRDKNKTDLVALNLQTGEKSFLSDDTLMIDILDNGNAPFAEGTSYFQHQVKHTYEYPFAIDYYKVNVGTGERTLLKSGIRNRTLLSPDGTYFIYQNQKTLDLFVLNTQTNFEECITCKAKAEWLEDLNGVPTQADQSGVVGFFPESKMIMLRSRADIWTYHLETKKLENLTKEVDSQDSLEFEIGVWNTDSTFLYFTDLYLKGINKSTRSESIYEFHVHNDHVDIIKVWKDDKKIDQLKKAKQSNQLIYTTSTVSEFPNLKTNDLQFSNEKKISMLNLQQKDYNWATVELVKWTTPKGLKLEGLMYKPENFDSTKKYPMIAYFYELYTQDIHLHYAPRPSASIINPIEYASAGYLVFIPDIRYSIGKPAQSAYDCIVGGTDAMLKQFPCIDPKRLGLQGQSWGGYQTAQLVTMTTKYAAAMAGAPVSNMISAYGGIRWGAGINRQFQYEQGQSRIGKTIWEAPELYIENSPIFHLNKVKTPLLIMANDRDGAVPWYQGIELFMGLRRLEQPVWMLNYNGDDHNLLNMTNRMDLSIRMRQFFDHYLLEKPAPQWLTEGIPAIVKGKEKRY